jgi:hypothetical protein
VLLCTVLALRAIASLQWPYYWDHGIFAWKVPDSLNETNIAQRFPAPARFISDGYCPVARVDAFGVHQRK